MICIYGFPNTRSTRAVWALEEAGVDYEYVSVDLSKGEHKKPEFLKVNPGGKVPTLVDGDFVLSESAAICTYIGEKFPDSGLVPSLIVDRAHYFQWCFFAMSELESPLWTMTKHTRILPEARRVPEVLETCLWEFQNAATVLAQHMKDREFIIGNQLTGADILLGSTLNWALKAGAVLEPAELAAYAERMAARPGLARARAREREAKIAS